MFGHRHKDLLKEPPSTPEVQWPRWFAIVAALMTLGGGLASLFSKKWLYSFPTTTSYGTNYTWGPAGYCYDSGAMNASECFMGYGSSFSDWPGTIWQLTLIFLCLANVLVFLAAIYGLAGLCGMCNRPDWHASTLTGVAMLLYLATVFVFPAGFGSIVHVEKDGGVRVCVFGGTYSIGGGCSLEFGYKLLLVTTCLVGLTLSLFLAADKMVVIRREKRRYAIIYRDSQGGVLPSGPHRHQ